VNRTADHEGSVLIGILVEQVSQLLKCCVHGIAVVSGTGMDIILNTECFESLFAIEERN
jgi:hypothetical protein